MFRTLRNLVVNIMAAFIRNRESRHKFRNKYKIKSKFRKLRDDNSRLFQENRRLFIENKSIINKLSNIENILNETRSIYWGYPSVIKQIDDSDITKLKHSHKPVYLSMACIAKNEGPYIKEWIEYHKIVGFERFYFYDNASDDNTREILEPYVNDGTVIYHYIDGVGRQLHVYTDAVLRYASETYWLALIDLDEFIVPKEKDNVPDFLKDYEQYPGVVINWVLFDSNGHKTKPTDHGGLVTYNYTRVKAGYKEWYGTRTIKSIVHPNHVARFINPHQAVYKGGISPVSESFEPVFGPGMAYCSVKKIQLNHYHCKSEEEYIKKIKKWNSASNWGKGRKYNADVLNYQDTTNDYAIQKFLPKLKIAMGVND